MSKGTKSEPAQNALLGDLESIRTLLTQDPAEERDSPDPQDDAGVPLLDDVVDGGGLGVNESLLVRPGDIPDEDAGGLDDAMFQALLGDEWREATSRILDDARETIEAHASEWSPADTDELNEALRVRIDAALKDWLKTLVMNNMNELRQLVARAIAAALEEQLQRSLGHRPDPAADDGPGR